MIPLGAEWSLIRPCHNSRLCTLGCPAGTSGEWSRTYCGAERTIFPLAWLFAVKVVVYGLRLLYHYLPRTVATSASLHLSFLLILFVAAPAAEILRTRYCDSVPIVEMFDFWITSIAASMLLANLAISDPPLPIPQCAFITPAIFSRTAWSPCVVNGSLSKLSSVCIRFDLQDDRLMHSPSNQSSVVQ